MIKTAHADSIRACREMIIGHFEQFDVFETETSTDQSGCYVGHIHSLGFSHFRVDRTGAGKARHRRRMERDQPIRGDAIKGAG